MTYTGANGYVLVRTGICRNIPVVSGGRARAADIEGGGEEGGRVKQWWRRERGSICGVTYRYIQVRFGIQACPSKEMRLA